jgi:hypothetical protein
MTLASLSLPSPRRQTFLLIASVFAALTVVGCGGTTSGTPGAGGTSGQGAGGTGGGLTGAIRAACYPPCLANLVTRCPLVSTCLSSLESSSSVPLPGESDGVAACYSTGERQRLATDVYDHAVVYVKAPDGSECYAAVREAVSTTTETWALSVGGQLFGYLTSNSGAVTVSCDDTTTSVDATKPGCSGLPWRNTINCETGSCSFGQIPSPGDWDAGTPCDPTLCTTPPPPACELDSVNNRFAIASYNGTPTCDNRTGCRYPKALKACDHGCHEGVCSGALTTLTNVQGKATVGGNVVPISLTAGAAPANSPVTITARTSARYAASTIKIEYGTCTANTLCIKTGLVFMALDPSTPAGQTDYDQWTVDLPAQPAGTKVEFDLYASESGGFGGVLSQASLGKDWSYTTQ